MCRYLGDGLSSSLVFREMAAQRKGKHIRVPERERNVITIFARDSRMQNRDLLNLQRLAQIALEEGSNLGSKYSRPPPATTADANGVGGAADGEGRLPFDHFDVHVVSFTDQDSFHTQALHMARTRILVTTHGSVISHCMFMEPGGVVLELNGFQFNYPMKARIVANRGHYYMRRYVHIR